MSEHLTERIFDFGILLATEEAVSPLGTIEALLEYCETVLVAVQPGSQVQLPDTDGRLRRIEIAWTGDRSLALNTLLCQVPVGSWCFHLDSNETLEPTSGYPLLPELLAKLRTTSSIIEFYCAEYIGDELNCYSLHARAWRQPAGDAYIGRPYAALRYPLILEAHPGEVNLAQVPVIRHQTSRESLIGTEHPGTDDSVPTNESLALAMRLRESQPGQHEIRVKELLDWQPTKELGDMSVLAWLCNVACDEEVSLESKREVLAKAERFLFRHKTLDLNVAFLAFNTGYISLAERIEATLRDVRPSTSDLLPYDLQQLKTDAFSLATAIKTSLGYSIDLELTKDWSVDDIDGRLLLSALRTGMLKTTGLDALYERYEKDREYDGFSRFNRLNMITFPIRLTGKDISHLRHVISSAKAALKLDDYLFRMRATSEDAVELIRKVVNLGPGTYRSYMGEIVVRFEGEV